MPRSILILFSLQYKHGEEIARLCLVANTDGPWDSCRCMLPEAVKALR